MIEIEDMRQWILQVFFYQIITGLFSSASDRSSQCLHKIIEFNHGSWCTSDQKQSKRFTILGLCLNSIHFCSLGSTGSLSFTREMIILRNTSHGENIRVCMGILTTLGIKKYCQILDKNTSPYFHSASLVVWPLAMLKRSHFSELSISRFTTP